MHTTQRLVTKISPVYVRPSCRPRSRQLDSFGSDYGGSRHGSLPAKPAMCYLFCCSSPAALLPHDYIQMFQQQSRNKSFRVFGGAGWHTSEYMICGIHQTYVHGRHKHLARQWLHALPTVRFASMILHGRQQKIHIMRGDRPRSERGQPTNTCCRSLCSKIKTYFKDL